MYARAGKLAPVTGWTGLWLFPGSVLVIPAMGKQAEPPRV